MFRDEQHPDVSLSDWEAFRKEFSPYLIEEVLDRSQLKLPDRFVPLARGVAIPSPYLLGRAGYRPGSRRPPGWCKPHCDVLWKDIGPDSLDSPRILRSSLVAGRAEWLPGSAARPPEYGIGPQFRVDTNSCPELPVSDVLG
jgi:hypothetical protein